MKTLGKIGKKQLRTAGPRRPSGSGSTWLEIPCNDVSSPKEFGQDFENHRAGRPKVEFCKFIHVFKRLLAKIELRRSTAPKRSNTKTFPHDFRKITKPAPLFENPGEKSLWWIAFGRCHPKAIQHKDFCLGFSKNRATKTRFSKILGKSLCVR